MTDHNRLRELLAALEHEQWAGWARAIFLTEELSLERRERWAATMEADYADLDEAAKDQDRVWADRVLAILQPLLDENDRLREALRLCVDLMTKDDYAEGTIWSMAVNAAHAALESSGGSEE